MAEGFLKVTVQNPLYSGEQTRSLIHNESSSWDLKTASVNAYMTAIYFTDGSEDVWEITPGEFNSYPTENWGFRLYTNGENYLTVECVSMSAYGKEITITPLWSENILYVNPNGGSPSGTSVLNPYEVVLHYDSTYTLPALNKSGYRYTGWNLTKNNDLRPADGKYNSSSKVFTQGYGIYTATAQFVADTGEDAIQGSYQHFSKSYKELGSTASGSNYRAALGYDIIEEDNYITINWYAYVQMHTNWQWGLGIQCEGKTATGALTTNPGTTYKNVASISGTKQVAKGNSPTTITISALAYGVAANGYGKAPGSVPLDVVIDIPAKDNYTQIKIYGCNNSPFSCVMRPGNSESVQIMSEIMPIEQFYLVEGIKVYLTENDYALDNLVDWVDISGEEINNDDRGIFKYSYNPRKNILTITAGETDLIFDIDWMPPTIGSNQYIYIYPETNEIYARNFVVSNNYYIDNDGTIYAPSFNNSDILALDQSGITAQYFIMGLPD